MDVHNFFSLVSSPSRRRLWRLFLSVFSFYEKKTTNNFVDAVRHSINETTGVVNKKMVNTQRTNEKAYIQYANMQ